MNLAALAAKRSEAGQPIRAGLIGAGKFGSMFLSQIPTTPGLSVPVIADLSRERAVEACRGAGWHTERIDATTFLEEGTSLCAHPAIEVVIEATGDPVAGVRHALAAIDHGKHLVMVNVEADVLAGPALAKRAASAALVYSMAYGDQPALVAELVDWARAAGFDVAAAGKGTKYLPSYHKVTPDDVWEHYGLAPEQARAAGMNPQMFNSFLDGTKSAIEMCAIANACDLEVPEAGLRFPPCGVDDLARTLCPKAFGGVLDTDGQVEVVSSLNRDGSPLERDLRWGVYAVLKAPNDYAAACFQQYGLPTDPSGQYAAMYKPFHLIGLELGISVLNIALRGEATGSSRWFKGDAVAIAKRNLKQGEVLDGEGGYMVWARAMPAAASLAAGALPIGMAQGVTLACDVPADAMLRWADVSGLDPELRGIRREAEALVQA